MISLKQYILDIELTNQCNANCIICPRDAISKRNLGLMTDTTFSLIIENCKKFYIPYINFCGLGEPLIHPKIFNYIKLIKTQLNSHVSLITNASLLNEKSISNLIDSNLDYLGISFLSINPTTYQKLMPNLNFESVLKNIIYVLKNAPLNLKISILFIKNKVNENEVNDFFNYWNYYKQYRDIKINISNIHTRGGYITDTQLMDPVKYYILNKKCRIFNFINFITWDGKILSCCHDVTAKNIIGDIYKDSFLSIQNKKEKFIQSNRLFDICYKCIDSAR